MAPRDELCHQVESSVGDGSLSGGMSTSIPGSVMVRIWVYGRRRALSSPTVSIACARQRQSDPPGWPTTLSSARRSRGRCRV